MFEIGGDDVGDVGRELGIGPEEDPELSVFLREANSDPLASRFFGTLGGRFTASSRERRARDTSAAG